MRNRSSSNCGEFSQLIHNKDKRTFALMMAPFMLLFFIFTVLPVGISVVLSFFDYDMISAPKFIGLQNYLHMAISDEVFPTALKNTMLLAVITGPLGFILSFVLAWFLNDFPPRARGILSFLFYAPALTGNAYYIWQVAFSGDSYGYVNSFLLSLGFITEPIQWFKDANYVVVIVIIIQLWMSMGVSFLANISGLQNVNPELYEAAALDGIRTRWHELWYITLPSMKTMLLFSAVMQISSAFSISEVATRLAGFPSVNNAVDTVVTHLNDVGTQRYELGYAAAISVMLFAIMAIFRVLVEKLLNLTGK